MRTTDGLIRAVCITILAHIFVWATPALSQTLDLTRSTLAAGGAAFSSAGNLTLSATIGEPVAGSLIAEPFSLKAGFWGASQAACLLDVDADGIGDVATDLVYIARHLLALPPVPASFRASDPAIPADGVIANAVDATGAAFDVDAVGGVDVATDLVYIARHLLGLPPVPASFRASNPTIPADVVVAPRIDALCPQ